VKTRPGSRAMVATSWNSVGVRSTFRSPTVEPDDLGLRPRTLGPPEHGSHPRHEFLGAERLRDVVVRANLEAHELVGLLAPAGEHDDRHVRLPTESPGDIEAVELGQTEIEHDEIRLLGARGGERGLSIVCHDHREAGVLEIVACELHDLRLVVDDHDLSHRRPNPR